jgi:hypothetical protein
MPEKIAKEQCPDKVRLQSAWADATNAYARAFEP